MRTIQMTMLVHDGPCARAYLAAMCRANRCPDRILLLVGTQHPTRRRALTPWLPRPWRIAVAQRYHESLNNYWARRLRAVHPQLVRVMGEGLRQLFADAPAMLDEMASRFPYASYTPYFERILVDNFRDPRLRDRLLQAPGPTPVLFTGGGILPRQLVETRDLRFLHVHPGMLPFVRGADGLLWSMLVRGNPAASCFYMARGIDRGNIITASEYPTLQFSVPERNRPDDQMLYRALFAFYDPLLRAHLLVQHVLSKGQPLAELPNTPQDESDGITYHFLHASIRHRALQLIFPAPARA